MTLIFFRLWRKLVKMKFSFPWKLQNPFFVHMHLKPTSLLKGMPREKVEVNPFPVLEIHCPLCPETSLSLGQIRTSGQRHKQTKKGQRDVLNLRQETTRSLSVCLDLCMSQCVLFFFFFYSIAEVVNEF